MNLNCNILHLEDNDNDSLFFQRALSRLQFSGAYRRASNVQQAIDYLSGTGTYADRRLYPLPDVLVADNALSGGPTTADLMAWLDAQPHLRGMHRVMLTGALSLADQQHWLTRGIAGILLKGASLGEFAVAVEQVLIRCVR
jgi:CheY-like chemotaxis protein